MNYADPTDGDIARVKRDLARLKEFLRKLIPWPKSKPKGERQ